MQMNKTLINLGDSVRFLRKSKGLTIEKLANKAGINKNYLCDLERGDRNPTVKILEKIADALDVNISNLFEEN